MQQHGLTLKVHFLPLVLLIVLFYSQIRLWTWVYLFILYSLQPLWNNKDDLCSWCSFCRTEREKYHKHILKAKRHPDKYISVIIDGMDQKVTSLPHFIQESKTTNGAWKLITHITGGIVHGRGHHAFIDLNEVPHDSNLTINVITSLLQRYSDSLPPTLYLQLDNCARENKNKYLFAFLSLLVELHIFQKVRYLNVEIIYEKFLKYVQTWYVRHMNLRVMEGYE